jgi:hypothetical protein
MMVGRVSLGWVAVGLVALGGCADGGAGRIPENTQGVASPLSWTDGPRLRGKNTTNGAHSGENMQLAGDTVLFTAPQNDFYTGAVFVFQRGAGGWTEWQKLTASDAEDYGIFGSSLAMAGETAVIGGRSVQTGLFNAYVFERAAGKWTETQKLPDTGANPENNSAFASAVAVDGDLLAIGSAFDDDAGVNAGAVYTYVRDNGAWVFDDKLTYPQSSGLHVGRSVSLSGDTLVVGAVNAAYAYVRENGIWSLPEKLQDHHSGGFGTAVVVKGDMAVVGAPGDNVSVAYSGAVYVYQRTGTAWALQKKLKADKPAAESLGQSVAFEGDTIVAGAFGADDGAGAAYVFARSAGGWTQQARLVAFDQQKNAALGMSVGISGGTVMAGATGDDYSAGSVYVFESACALDAECPAGNYCGADHVCQQPKPLGAACSDTQCSQPGCGICAAGADHCVDGVCCDTAAAECSGCQACAAVHTGQSDGSCAAVVGGQDPNDACMPGATGECAADGNCDGAGACRAAAVTGTACGSTECHDGEVFGSVCDGSGACVQSSLPCAPYDCDGSVCGVSCESTAGCAEGTYCGPAQTCMPAEPDGASCAEPSACSSGHCVDGVCCESECAGTCEACAEPDHEGQCRAISGEPRGSREACSGQGDCAGSCDGAVRERCVFPEAGTQCKAVCRKGASTLSQCDGAGACVQGSPTPCAPFACAPDSTCFSDCRDNGQCAVGYVCQGGECAPAPEEEPTPIGGAPGAVDDARDEPDPGCSCRLVPARPSSGLVLVPLGLVMLRRWGAARRKQRCK